ncbi:hypothetical protein COCNU_12G002180 [Cocos nucifera]|uniref:Uncharacterized protein n=1 Tax=Cocos nucifera TaxID=13894 RepID=A0A8K0IRK3_COCNU|nr:hypothetical protein COCNU_12G002180 [Cocos nucifera]
MRSIMDRQSTTACMDQDFNFQPFHAVQVMKISTESSTEDQIVCQLQRTIQARCTRVMKISTESSTEQCKRDQLLEVKLLGSLQRRVRGKLLGESWKFPHHRDQHRHRLQPH